MTSLVDSLHVIEGLLLLAGQADLGQALEEQARERQAPGGAGTVGSTEGGAGGSAILYRSANKFSFTSLE